MSRIGIRPITIPAGVEVTVEDGNVVKVKGPKGELCSKIGSSMKVNVEDGTLKVERPDDSRENRSQHGLARTLIDNMITGVTKGFERKLLILRCKAGQEARAEAGIFTPDRTRGSGRYYYRDSGCKHHPYQGDRQGTGRQLRSRHQSMETA